VRDLANERAVLPHSDFVAICKDPGGGAEPIIEANEQRALLRLLHDLGAIVAQGLERDAPAARREINLLDPNWLTGAIYLIMDKARSVDQEGEFLRRQLVDWLDPALYPPERHEFILDMMQDRDMGLQFAHGTRRELSSSTSIAGDPTLHRQMARKFFALSLRIQVSATRSYPALHRRIPSKPDTGKIPLADRRRPARARLRRAGSRRS
jgi:C-terminal of Roc, COR, domain